MFSIVPKINFYYLPLCLVPVFVMSL